MVTIKRMRKYNHQLLPSGKVNLKNALGLHVDKKCAFGSCLVVVSARLEVFF